VHFGVVVQALLAATWRRKSTSTSCDSVAALGSRIRQIRARSSFLRALRNVCEEHLTNFTDLPVTFVGSGGVRRIAKQPIKFKF